MSALKVKPYLQCIFTCSQMTKHYFVCIWCVSLFTHSPVMHNQGKNILNLQVATEVYCTDIWASVILICVIDGSVFCVAVTVLFLGGISTS